MVNTRSFFTSTKLYALALVAVLGVSLAVTVFAQEDPSAIPSDAPTADEELAPTDTVPTSPEQEFMRGKVIQIVDEQPSINGGYSYEAQQTVMVELRSGEQKGKVITLDYVFSNLSFDQLKLHQGNKVVVAKVSGAPGQEAQFYILDNYRLPGVMLLTVAFGLLACILGRRKGAGALVGLVASIAVIMLIVVPWIIKGGDPLLASLVGSFIIAISSMLLAHGFNKRTWVALAATLTTLVLSVGLALLAVYLAGLTGSGTEEAIFLQVGYLSGVNLRGLLLGAIIIGTLGVLDDVTTAQVAAIEEIHKADKRLSRWELYQRGLSVGREHIASLVNTLILAYVGASFPLFLLFAMPDHSPIWVVLNGENIVEEVVRALVGGAALMLAVPISTAFAAFAFGHDEHKSKY